jgi:hypothetical protein
LVFGLAFGVDAFSPPFGFPPYAFSFMLYAFSHATRKMVRGLVGDDLMLARINFIVLAHFKHPMDFRRFFCFAKKGEPLMTGSMAMEG